MKVVSFNVNSVRVRLHQLEAVCKAIDPDIIALQETKVIDEDFPREDIAALGFPHIYAHGQKGHYGVAILSKTQALEHSYGFPWRAEDQQRRMVRGKFSTAIGDVWVYNGYFPQGESREHPTKFPAKEQFYADLSKTLAEDHKPDDNLLVVGDMNIAREDIDIGIGEDNRKRWLKSGKASFLPEEREWLETLMDYGFVDTYATHYATKSDSERLYSWFDYRSKGFDREPKRGLRIDLMLATTPLNKLVNNVGIDYAIRGMERPSDHCPIWCEFG